MPKLFRRARAIVKSLRGAPRFECPCCGWHGVFLDLNPATGFRPDAECPACGARERHRLQHLVMDKVLHDLPTRQMRMLHFAPERFLGTRFRRQFGGYETADIERTDVDHRVDLQSLSLPDAGYDVVYASHVLEHVPDDRAAIREIRRILKPGGFAVLPVPIVADHTIEYPEPNPRESMHVRAPGPDYFDRYREVFRRVEVIDSGTVDVRYQPFTSEMRKAGMVRLPDYVPICHA